MTVDRLGRVRAELDELCTVRLHRWLTPPEQARYDALCAVEATLLNRSLAGTAPRPAMPSRGDVPTPRPARAPIAAPPVTGGRDRLPSLTGHGEGARRVTTTAVPAR